MILSRVKKTLKNILICVLFTTAMLAMTASAESETVYIPDNSANYQYNEINPPPPNPYDISNNINPPLLSENYGLGGVSSSSSVTENGESITFASFFKSHKILCISVISFMFLLIMLFTIYYKKCIRYAKLYSEKIKHNTDYDILTGSRTLPRFLVDSEKVLGENSSSLYAVIYINICDFKYINEMFGYNEGNTILKLLAESIRQSINKNELYCRVNNDNFAVLMEYKSPDDILERLNIFKYKLYSCDNAVKLNYTITIAGGIYLLVENYANLELSQIVERAEIAQRYAKNNKDTSFVFYKEKMRLSVLKENEIVKNMKSALEKKEFQVYYQPQHNIQENDVVNSAEALVRWIKPSGEVIPPGDFIPLFEKNGFIVELDKYVFLSVCEFIHEHISEGKKPIPIAVNVSRFDLNQSDFTEYYSSVKNTFGIPDGIIELEFTESLVFSDYKKFKKIISKLKANGFRCSLDDFGSGSSSLNVLKELPVDVLKMDRQFFYDIDDIKCNNSVIASVITLARGLGMKVIAEGIERSEQVEFLRRIGCEIIQGFYFSKPLPAKEFKEYLRSYKKNYSNDTSSGLIKVKLNEIVPESNIIDHNILFSVLHLIDSFVFVINLDKDMSAMVTNSELSHATRYEQTLEKTVIKCVKEDDREMVFNKISLKSIISDFYTGNNRISLMCHIAFDNDVYKKYHISIINIDYISDKPSCALGFIQSTDNSMGYSDMSIIRNRFLKQNIILNENNNENDTDDLFNAAL